MKIKRTKVAGLGLNLLNDCPAMIERTNEDGYLPPLCIPCWNRLLNKRFRPDHIPKNKEEIVVDRNITELLKQLDSGKLPNPVPEEKCQFYQLNGHDIILSPKTEFFHKAAGNLPYEITRILGDQYPQIAERCRILTKQKITKFEDIPVSMMIGASITTLQNSVSRAVQPYTALPSQLIRMLQNAHRQGYKTWVVVEPFYQGMSLVQLVKILPFLTELWVGRLNAGRDLPVPNTTKTVGDFAMPDRIIVNQIEAARKQILLSGSKTKLLVKREVLFYLTEKNRTEQKEEGEKQDEQKKRTTYY